MIEKHEKSALLRLIPQVDALMTEGPVSRLAEEHGREVCLKLIKSCIEDIRNDILSELDVREEDLSPDAFALRLREALRAKERRAFQTLINATGIVLHTNLGRAPLGERMALAVREAAESYGNLEYRLESGRRGSRYDAVEPLLCELTGAEAAMVVNNNAGAMLLILDELARGHEVIVSRGELVEIGGAFRVPDVMTQSGARLCEVGCTNKTRLRDYELALNEETAAILKVHRSNFRLEGFTEEASLEELRSLADEKGLPLIYDLGSGLMHPNPPECLKNEPTVRQGMEAGCDIVCFSGDKLLGGPQAGIIIGKKRFIERLKKNPLTRALRCDKLCLSGLQELLQIYLHEEEIDRQIPIFLMLKDEVEAIEQRADVLCDLLERAGVEAKLVHLEGEVGGGSAPGVRLPSAGIALDPVNGRISAKGLEKALRFGSPPVIAYIRDEQVVFDLRTVKNSELELLSRCIIHAWQTEKGEA